MESLQLHPIGYLHSPFREKFGIPRQPGLVPHAISRLILLPEFASDACVEGITDFSHLWLIFAFHATAEQGWQPKVRPPRLGGNQFTGVFSTRSMFRPNPIGLSVVELLGIEKGPNGNELILRGADLLDATPVLDIKPYVPYSDSIAEARAGFAAAAPELLKVEWSAAALTHAQQLALSDNMRYLVEEVLAQDPRPAYRAAQQDEREYGVWLENINVRFCVTPDGVQILALEEKIN
ncbi:MAG TPA: tRNA (N6-threonylcarbamoyladenosine(37)-N6)-methyltransferase TrmO [Pseudomonadales bacterium]|nr:tRNA (N6-threonylcarbamoyladenosine(37)-N6)-methyltransferase TrmO [Pseudomonadales bacterium]